MVAEGGGFAASLDADSEGEEGRFYVWREDEIDAALGPESELFKRFYDVTPEGNWEGKTILNRRRAPPADAKTEARLAVARAKLLTLRERRVRPGWDDKVLADWNGLMIVALANAGHVFGERQWLDAAARAFAFVRDRMSIEGRLQHSWRKGRLKPPGTLEDHAAMARAALALHEATAEGAYLDQARAWVAVLDRHHWDQDGGGYFTSADDTGDVIHRNRTAADSATPSGNGTMAAVLARLHYLTGEPDYRERAEAVQAAFAGMAQRNVFPFATLLNAADLLQSATQVVLVGAADDPGLARLEQAVLDRSLPNRILLKLADGDRLPASHPAAGKGRVEGRATAYVCRGQTCSLPIMEPAALGKALQF
jgi:hypothetical protein